MQKQRRVEKSLSFFFPSTGVGVTAERSALSLKLLDIGLLNYANLQLVF